MLVFEKVFNKEISCNAFLVGCSETAQIALIDPCFGPCPFAELVARENWTITHILDTHLSSHCLQGGYMAAASVGATYVSAFARQGVRLTCHFMRASNERCFYIGKVKVTMKVEGSDVVYTFAVEGGISRSVSKIGEVGAQTDLRRRSMKEDQDDELLQRDKQLPFYYYGQRVTELNYNFTLPIHPKPKPLPPKLFFEYMARGRQIVDLRPNEAFEQKFIPGSIFIGQSYIAAWLPYLIDCRQKLILVGEERLPMQKSITEIHQLGSFEVEGYLDATLQSWDHLEYPLMRIESLEPEAFFKGGFELIIDVRTETEVAHQPIEGAINIPLRYLHQHKKMFKEKACGFFCSGGCRSLRAASLALNFGASECAHLKGGVLAYPHALA